METGRNCVKRSCLFLNESNCWKSLEDYAWWPAGVKSEEIKNLPTT